jgi:RNA polymerase sigma factor (sigma-70 family)
LTLADKVSALKEHREEAAGVPETSRDSDAELVGLRQQLHRYLARHVRSAEDARDLAQEVYARYLKTAGAGIREPDRYLFRIAINLVRERRLQRERSAVTFDSTLAEEHASTLVDGGADVYERLTTREQLMRALEKVPENYRRVLLMNKVDGLTFQEIATRLGLSPETVLTYIARATACARGALAEMENDTQARRRP